MTPLSPDGKEYVHVISKDVLQSPLGNTCNDSRFGDGGCIRFKRTIVYSCQKLLAEIGGLQPVYYDSVLVFGDLNLKSLPDARVKSSLALTNCTIVNATFDGVTFDKEAIFWGTTFENASFEKTSFLGLQTLPTPLLAMPASPLLPSPSQLSSMARSFSIT